MPTAMTTTQTMKAVRIHSFGGPDTLVLEEVPVPEPGANELLVRVHAAGVNPVDWKIREGYLGSMPFPAPMGTDFSGVVESVGPGVIGFQVGDPVFGEVAEESGSYAEYAVAPVIRVARKPASLDDRQAAALPIAALTAWQALFDVADLKGGQKVLIHGGAGGVGSFAIQFAKLKGAHVVATTSARNMDFVRQLGADEVIDYRGTPFEEVAQDCDVVFDTIGGETQERSWKALKRGGILVSIVQPPAQEIATAHGSRGVFMISQARGDQLAVISDLVARGKVVLHIETVLPLEEARQAQELSQSGHVRGKIVLVVDSM